MGTEEDVIVTLVRRCQELIVRQGHLSQQASFKPCPMVRPLVSILLNDFVPPLHDECVEEDLVPVHLRRYVQIVVMFGHHILYTMSFFEKTQVLSDQAPQAFR